MKRAIYQIYAKIRLEIARGLFDNSGRIGLNTSLIEARVKKPIWYYFEISMLFMFFGEGLIFGAFVIRLFSKLHSYQTGLCSG